MRSSKLKSKMTEWDTFFLIIIFSENCFELESWNWQSKCTEWQMNQSLSITWTRKNFSDLNWFFLVRIFMSLTSFSSIDSLLLLSRFILLSLSSLCFSLSMSSYKYHIWLLEMIKVRTYESCIYQNAHLSCNLSMHQNSLMNWNMNQWHIL